MQISIIMIFRILTLTLWALITTFYFRGGKSVVDDIGASKKSLGNNLPSILITAMSVLVISNFIFSLLTTFDIVFFRPIMTSFPVIVIFCLLLVMFHIIICITRFVFLGKNWGANIKISKGQEVVYHGPYNIIRHPIYLLSALHYACFIVSFSSITVIITTTLIIITYFLLTAAEDSVLSRDLNGYEDYKKKVKYKMIPFIW